MFIIFFWVVFDVYFKNPEYGKDRMSGFCYFRTNGDLVRILLGLVFFDMSLKKTTDIAKSATRFAFAKRSLGCFRL